MSPARGPQEALRRRSRIHRGKYENGATWGAVEYEKDAKAAA